MPKFQIFPDGRAAGSTPVSGSDFVTKDYLDSSKDFYLDLELVSPEEESDYFTIPISDASASALISASNVGQTIYVRVSVDEEGVPVKMILPVVQSAYSEEEGYYIKLGGYASGDDSYIYILDGDVFRGEDGYICQVRMHQASEKTPWRYGIGTNGNEGAILTISSGKEDNIGRGAVIVGLLTTASGDHSFVEGSRSLASGIFSHAEGRITTAEGSASHAEGNYSVAVGQFSHVEGTLTRAVGAASHAEGIRTTASAEYSHAEGSMSIASGSYSHAEGARTLTQKAYSHAEGFLTTASGVGAHAEGLATVAAGNYSHAEGSMSIASGSWSHAEGKRTLASGDSSHAEGFNTTASGQYSHAEGSGSKALGSFGHVEGTGTSIGINVYNGHAEGSGSSIVGDYGSNAHVEGIFTVATNNAEHAGGQYNATASNQIFSIGVGSRLYGRKNAISIITGSNPTASIYLYGIGGYDGTNPTPGTNDIATVINSLTGSLASASYSSTDKKIYFYNGSGTVSAEVDATDFIKDGMVDTVTVNTGSGQMIITFNTDAGKEDIELSLTDIFNPNNYYTKTDVNTLLTTMSVGDVNVIEAIEFNGTASSISGKTASINFEIPEGALTVRPIWTASSGEEASATGSYRFAPGTYQSVLDAYQAGRPVYLILGPNHEYDDDPTTTTTGLNSESILKLRSVGYAGVDMVEFASEVGYFNEEYTNAVEQCTLHGHEAGDWSVIPVPGPWDLEALESASNWVTENSASIVTESIWVRGTGTNSAILSGSYNNVASNSDAIAHGNTVTASGQYSHAEGSGSIASGKNSHAEGIQTRAVVEGGHSEGYQTLADGNIAWASNHAEGYNTTASGQYSHAEGHSTRTVAGGTRATAGHAEGYGTLAYGDYSHAEGESGWASGRGSHKEGENAQASGRASHAEGSQSKATGNASHAEGQETIASGQAAHAEGRGTTAFGLYSHAEGYSVSSSGTGSHAEGYATEATGSYSHAEGIYSHAVGIYSHAEGSSSIAIGTGSHAEGYRVTASGQNAHAEGLNTVADNNYEHAQGRYNATASSQIFSIGVGDTNARRKNAIAIITGSNPSASVYIYGVGTYKGTNPEPGVNDLATIISNISASSGGGGITAETDPIYVADSASLKDAASWVGSNSSSVLTSETDPIYLADSASLKASASLASSSNYRIDHAAALVINKGAVTTLVTQRYGPTGSVVTIQIPTTASHLGAANATHSHAIADVTGLSAIVSASQIVLAKTASWDASASLAKTAVQSSQTASMKVASASVATTADSAKRVYASGTIVNTKSYQMVLIEEEIGTDSFDLTMGPSYNPVSKSLSVTASCARTASYNAQAAAVTAITASLVASASVAKTASSSAAAISAKTGSYDALVGLPAVTAADNGKILRVVNGAWALVDPVTVYSGQGAPDSALGQDGDIYLQS